MGQVKWLEKIDLRRIRMRFHQLLGFGILLLIFNLRVSYAEDGSCSKDDQDCGAELKSGMVEQTINENDITKEDDDEGIVEEKEGEKKQDEIDTEEVDGAFEPCT